MKLDQKPTTVRTSFFCEHCRSIHPVFHNDERAALFVLGQASSWMFCPSQPPKPVVRIDSRLDSEEYE